MCRRLDHFWPHIKRRLITLRRRRVGRRTNGFLGLSLNDGTILFLEIFVDKTVSVGEDSPSITTLASGLAERLFGHLDQRSQNASESRLER